MKGDWKVQVVCDVCTGVFLGEKIDFQDKRDGYPLP